MTKIQDTRPDLTGADLVQAVQLAHLNAAELMKDIHYPDTYISPRRTGAGTIDVTQAGDSTVSAEGQQDAGSVSSGQIGTTNSYSVTLTHHGKTATNYVVDTHGGPHSTVTDTRHGHTVHDKTHFGDTVNTDTAHYSLAAGETQTDSFKSSLEHTVAEYQLVEGYCTFKAGDTSTNNCVPYLG